MLVKDELSQQREAAALAIDQYADKVNTWTKDTLSRGVVALGDYANSLICPQRQMGHMMLLDQFERIVAALSPSLLTGVHPLNAARKCVWQLRPDGSREFITAYENGPMPEYSIFTAKYEWVPDLDYVGTTEGSPRVVQRGDVVGAPVSLQTAYDLIKTHGMGGALTELKKRNADTVDPENKPGMRKILKLGSEGIRGWRTHLVYIVQHKACSLGDVERVLIAEHLVAPANNASWARRTGAQAVATAW